MDDLTILIDWQDANAEGGSRWDWTLALYAVLHPTDAEILYLGKADGTRVAARWSADDKHERVWRRIEGERRIFNHCFIVGEFHVPPNVRLTRTLVGDVESLLIHMVKPWANTHCVTTRNFYRPGMVVRCQGEWPLRQRTFCDQ